jgi:hypothetical protein
MNILNYNEQTLTTELIKRVNDIDQRERIVIKMPFAHDINRIEIYCSETYGNPSVFGGEPFPGIVTIQQFNDYTNKPYGKTSYTFKGEFLRYIPNLVGKLYAQLTVKN